MPKKKISIRKALHTIGNRHHLGILVPDFIRRAVNDILASDNISERSKKRLEKIIKDLDNLKQAGKEADSMLKQIKPAIYDKIDPGSIIEIESVDPDL
jgi:hypothetical protein